LKTYDTALPQTWLDGFAKKLQEFFGGETYDAYSKILSSFVWSYDGSFIGQPYPLTLKAIGFLRIYDVAFGTHYAEAQEYTVILFPA
jgi:hypothetical protein